MIKSMTGFGRCEMAENDRKFTVEIKSVNHRYLDVSIKLPKALNFFESSIRSELKSYISRGKVDVYVSYEDFSEKTSVVCYHRELAEEYLRYLRRMGEEFGLENDVRVSTLSRFPRSSPWKRPGWTRRSCGRSCWAPSLEPPACSWTPGWRRGSI